MAMDTVLTPSEALKALEDCYDALLEALPDARRAEDTRGALSNLFSGHSYHPGLDALMDKYVPLLSAHVAALAQAVQASPGPEAQAAALRGLERLLFYPKPSSPPEEFTLVALEGHGLPLAPLLSPEARLDLAQRYAKQTPPRRMMPNQKKLWKLLAGK